MRLKLTKNKKERLAYKSLELQNKLLKSLLLFEGLNTVEKQYIIFKYHKAQKKSSKIKISTRCILTNRSRSIYKKFKISRIQFRENAANGELSGFQKSSW